MTRKRTTINETRPDQTGINQVIHDTFYTYSWYPLVGMHSTVHTSVGSSVCRPKKTSSILWAHSARRRNRIPITVNDGHNGPAIPFFAFWMSFFLLICRLFVYLVLLRVFYNLIHFFGSAAHKRTPNSVCGFVANQSNKHINFRLNFSCICIGDQDQDQSVSTTNKSQVRKDEC